jgi:hypothetical protein
MEEAPENLALLPPLMPAVLSVLLVLDVLPVSGMAPTVGSRLKPRSRAVVRKTAVSKVPVL